MSVVGAGDEGEQDRERQARGSFGVRRRQEKTQGGLTKAKLVSKAHSAATKKRYAGSKAQKWAKACSKARKELNIKGFCPFGGKTAAGKALYAKAKAIYNA